MLGQEKAIKMSGQSFNTSQIPLAFYDPQSSSWKMSQESLLSEEPELLERLPKSGMTQDGKLLELQMSERVTNGQGGFALLVTPTATEKEAGRAERYVSRGIMNDRSTRFDLTDQIAYLTHLLPTPTAWQQSEELEQWEERVEDYSKKKGSKGRRVGTPLSMKVKMLPTPTVQDSANNAAPSQWSRHTDPLNVVAAKLTGETMPDQSEDGN